MVKFGAKEGEVKKSQQKFGIFFNLIYLKLDSVVDSLSCWSILFVYGTFWFFWSSQNNADLLYNRMDVKVKG